MSPENVEPEITPETMMTEIARRNLLYNLRQYAVLAVGSGAVFSVIYEAFSHTIETSFDQEYRLVALLAGLVYGTFLSPLVVDWRPITESGIYAREEKEREEIAEFF